MREAGGALRDWLVPLVVVLIGLGSAPVWAELPGGPGDSSVAVVIDSPAPDEIVRNKFDLAPFAGVASTDDRPTQFDLILVVDVSGSTEYCSQVDVDGDGILGRREKALVPGLPDTKCNDRDDSILAAELRAARSLLEELDPERIRVGLVSFSGRADDTGASRHPSSTVDATLQQPLSDDFSLVLAALDRIWEVGPSGGTNMAHGIRLAAFELSGDALASSRPRPDARRVILFLTDGEPSLPYGLSNRKDVEDIEAAIAAAQAAAKLGIVINVYGLGPTANSYPEAPRGMTRATGGVYRPVERPGDIVSVFSGVSFANVDSVVAVNLTLGEMAELFDIQLRPDGTFRGFVPVAPGKNRVRVSAFATDGRRGSTEFEIDFRHSELSEEEKQAELERIRERTRAILLDRERRRQEEYRAQERERSLDIEVDGPGSEENKR